MELATTIATKLKDILRGNYFEDQMKIITFLTYAIQQNEYIVAVLYQDNTDKEEMIKAMKFIDESLEPESYIEHLMKIDTKTMKEVIIVIDSTIRNCSKQKSVEIMEFKLDLIKGMELLINS
tara:strand:- start:30 stop:395 length:366 start_codon:yes stop_codon:yes gene_type:complete